MGRGGRAKRAKRRTVKAAGRARQSEAQFQDLFGFEREAKIASSNVRNVFTPHQPISEVNLLFGRTDEIRNLVETLNTPGQHVLLYGERGVGKSSLANVASNLVLQMLQSKIYIKRCDQSDTFESILHEPLSEARPELYQSEVSATESSSKHGGLGAGPIDAGRERGREVTRTYPNRVSISPSTAGRALADMDGLLVVDEFDAIREDSDKGRVSELIKQLSDGASPFKIMVVGIAASASELTAAHPSVQRNLRETKLRRMEVGELREIVTVGAEAIGISFK
ncbi:AAA ATPase domain-containing protein [Prauserella aidingensis]|uniref:ATP-binding protein n=1 Tax=Prauserella aidingensis TaxID=387890 RepID=UPI0020A3BAD6|nr:ATP-binding protein [Prauserella aidingensis]MCP2256295.1 AAA ATPase domain-containing protein [Prauserella aidingensis]